MPEIARNLPQPDDYRPGYVNPAVSNGPAMLARGINTAAGVGVAVYQHEREQSALDAFAKANESLDKEERGYAVQVQKVVDAASSAKDKEALAGFNQKLARLYNGEVQGVMSPSEVAIKRRKLLQDYSSQYGHLGTEFRQIAAAHAGYLNHQGGVAAGDPAAAIAKWRNEVAVESMETGIPFEVLVKWNRHKIVQEANHLEAQAMADRGQGSFSHTRTLIEDGLMDIYGDALTYMKKQLKSGDFNVDNVNAYLANLKVRARHMVHTTVDDMSHDETGRTLWTLDAPQRDDINNDIENMITGLETIAKSKDPAAQLDHFLQYAKNQDLAQTRDLLGTYGFLVRTEALPKDTINRWVQFAPRFFNKILNNRMTMKQLQQRADMNDPNAAAVLSMIDYGALNGNGLVRMQGQVWLAHHDVSKYSWDLTNPYVKKLLAASGVLFAAQQADGSEAKAHQIEETSKAIQTDAGEAVNTALITPAFIEKFKSNSELQDAVKRETTAYIISGAQDYIRGAVFEGGASPIVYDPDNKTAPFSLAYKDEKPISVTAGWGGMVPTARERYIDTLNRFARLFSLTMSDKELEEWEKNVIEVVGTQIAQAKITPADEEDVIDYVKDADGNLVPAADYVNKGGK